MVLFLPRYQAVSEFSEASDWGGGGGGGPGVGHHVSANEVRMQQQAIITGE